MFSKKQQYMVIMSALTIGNVIGDNPSVFVCIPVISVSSQRLTPVFAGILSSVSVNPAE